ncbi:MAG: glutathione peroxidase [Bacteroidales bacterium]|nr:glutathione peroxidase [Bacteroidales bacterium]
MKRLIFLFIVPILLGSINKAMSQESVFYSFRVKALDGSEFDFSTLQGKKVLVVNTASKCGLTPQYKELQKLYDTYGGQYFTVIGLPANNFMNQEPGTDEEIRDFCDVNYGVTFPMMSKISVRGDDMHPLYQWLTSKKLNGVMDSEVSWNFQKYLVDENGRLVDMLPPKESPLSERVINWINE